MSTSKSQPSAPLPAPTLPTERLLLRPFFDADADDLYALHSDPSVLRYWDSPPWTDPARAQRFLGVTGPRGSTAPVPASSWSATARSSAGAA